MSAQLDFFNAVRVNTIAQAVYDQRLNPQPLVWSNRIPAVPAWDDEIMARFVGFPLIADIIVDDAKAVTYQFGKFEFYSSKAPKLKVGATMNERTLRQARRLQQNMLTNDEVGVFRDWERRTIQAVRYGIDLKVTAGTTWNNTSATPITDIQTVRRLARIRYGAFFNRLTMTTQDLLYMTATTEFLNQSKFYVSPYLFGGPAPAAPVQSDGFLRTLAERVLSGGIGGDQNGAEGPLTIELDDRRGWTQDSNGKTRSFNLHPVGKIVLTDNRQDGNTATWDWAQGENIEAVVADLVPGQAPVVPAIRGPVVYPTLTAPDLNSPGVTYWATETGFPRKHNRASSAVITAGTYTDGITDALPF